MMRFLKTRIIVLGLTAMFLSLSVRAQEIPRSGQIMTRAQYRTFLHDVEHDAQRWESEIREFSTRLPGGDFRVAFGQLEMIRRSVAALGQEETLALDMFLLVALENLPTDFNDAVESAVLKASQTKDKDAAAIQKDTETIQQATRAVYTQHALLKEASAYSSQLFAHAVEYADSLEGKQRTRQQRPVLYKWVCPVHPDFAVWTKSAVAQLQHKRCGRTLVGTEKETIE